MMLSRVSIARCPSLTRACQVQDARIEKVLLGSIVLSTCRTSAFLTPSRHPPASNKCGRVHARRSTFAPNCKSVFPKAFSPQSMQALAVWDSATLLWQRCHEWTTSGYVIHLTATPEGLLNAAIASCTVGISTHASIHYVLIDVR